MGEGTHLGYGGRLAGPVDNPRSSCLSCHATGQFKVGDAGIDMIPPSRASETEIMKWFVNVKTAQAMNPGFNSTDYSLQLMISMYNFHLNKPEEARRAPRGRGFGRGRGGVFRPADSPGARGDGGSPAPRRRAR